MGDWVLKKLDFEMYSMAARDAMPQIGALFHVERCFPQNRLFHVEHNVYCVGATIGTSHLKVVFQ